MVWVGEASLNLNPSAQSPRPYTLNPKLCSCVDVGNPELQGVGFEQARVRETRVRGRTQPHTGSGVRLLNLKPPKP